MSDSPKRQLRRPRPNASAAAVLSGSASGRVDARIPATSIPANFSRMQVSWSSVNPSMSIVEAVKNMAAAVSGARQPKIDTIHSSVSPSARTRIASADSSSSSPSSVRMQDCSSAVNASNRSPQRVSLSISNSPSTGPPPCSAVGAIVGVGVDVGGTGVGVAVLVAGAGTAVGRAAGVAVDPSPHADNASRRLATLPAQPIPSAPSVEHAVPMHSRSSHLK